MIDHSNTEEEAKRPEEQVKKGKKRWGKIVAYFFLFILFLLLVGGGVFIFKFPTFAKAASNFVFYPRDRISTNNDRVNILVMGKSGGNHDGPDLTDTMMLISLSVSKPAIKIISIPRDIWIPEIMSKINSAYYWGKTGSPYFSIQETGGGISFAKKITGEVTGQPIQYGIVVDFSSFKDVIDALGGISVNVENTFTDKLYPIAGREDDNCGGDATFACRYETVTFNSGMQQMNGEAALKFVRSRHAEGDEGTDIAREARQQKVITAIKEKIIQKKVFLNPKIDLAMIGIINKYIETDIDLPTAGILARLGLEGSKNISQFLIPEDLLVNPPTSKLYENLYVFIPKLGNGRWEEINKWIAEALNK